MGSYLQAKHHDGDWLLRIDDIDPPREQKGAADNILATLESFGFEWDESVLYQSSRQKYYQDAVDELIHNKLAYPCSCSRASISKKTGQSTGDIIYPGFCRNGPLQKSSQYSIRLRCDDKLIHFNDALQGKQSVNLEKVNGDFILQRRDHYFSYHLASGIDDAEQNITEVVRGADLLNCTPCHLHIQNMLNLSSPDYCHLPIAVNNAGQKLCKQHHAAPINAVNSVALLYKSLKFLGQNPPIELMESNLAELWCWAKTHWQLDLVPNKTQKINSNIK